MEITPEDLKLIVEEAVTNAIPKRFLSKEELSKEYGVKSTTISKLIIDPIDPLPYTSMCSRKLLFDRIDVEAFLVRRKRNIN